MNSNHPVIPEHGSGMSPIATARCGTAWRSPARVRKSTLVVIGSGLAAALRPAMTAAGLEDLLP
jgi:hypothetical protein